ncbi:MAG: ABC transporter ATP-binding protein [Thermodesulfobacteriota bacterium]
MLKVKNVIKDYSTGFLGKKTRVLHDVTFDVKFGEVFGFVGPNGAGKTTTFKSILQFVSITSGNIEIKGEINNNNSKIKSLIGYLPESPYFYDYLTGKELLIYMGKLHGVETDILNNRVNDLLHKVNMNHAKNVQLRKFSKGMLQRIGIAQAMINDPEFLILDEPMSGLDPIGRREIMDLILEQKAAKKTILLSSHILYDVESLCDRVGVILNGKVVKIGVLAELFKEINTDYEMFVYGNKETLINKLDKEQVSLEERAGFIILRFDEKIKAHVINALLNTDVEIISMYPLRKSLEGLFLEEQKKHKI